MVAAEFSAKEAEDPGTREETLDLINAELADRLTRQADSSAKIDTKATALTGYALAGASFLATQHPEAVLAGIAFGAYAVSAGLSIAAGAVGRYQDVPAPRPLFNKYAIRSRADALTALGATRVRAFEGNALRHERKARLWLASAVFLAFGAVLMIAAILVHNH